MTQKTDARGVRALYIYQFSGGDDPLNRLQRINYDTAGPRDTSIPINSAPASNFTYMTTGDKMRVQEIDSEYMVNQAYTYDAEGRVSKYTQKIKWRESQPMEVDYLYDTLNRVTEMKYPERWNNGGGRRIVLHEYDTASRLQKMSYGTTGSFQQHAGDLVYNAAYQTTQMKIGPASTHQVTEDYTFDPQTGLLTNQKATRAGTPTPLLDLSYEYNKAAMIFGLIAVATGFGSLIAGHIAAKQAAAAAAARMPGGFALAGPALEAVKTYKDAAMFGILSGVGAISNSFRKKEKPSSVQGIVDQSVLGALARLKGACLDYIGVGSKKILETIKRRKQVVHNQSVVGSGNVARSTEGLQADGTIYVGDEFFKDNPGGWKKSTDLGSAANKINTARKVREMTILHELRHVVTGIVHDGAAGNSAVDFNQEIANKCF